MHPVSKSLALLVVLTLPLASQGADLLVDAGGVGGAYVNITQAMLVANPGDRILVMPGTYPTFQFSRGVSVIGLGNQPGDVTIERIAYHVSIPSEHYETAISNVRIQSGQPLDVFAINGNELAPGTLTIDGCILENGVYLRGGQAGFYLYINNSRIVPPPGHGFSGEAARLGGPGNFVEIRNSRIVGWDADATAFAPAGAAVRFDTGTLARVTGSELLAGSGTGSGLYAWGATAIETISGGTVQLGIDGNSEVMGGDGLNAPGGHGTDIDGQLRVGSATIAGGGGIPPGLDHAGIATIAGSGTLALNTDPAWSHAEEGVALEPGQTLEITVPSGPGVPLLGLSFHVLLPDSTAFVSLPMSTALLLTQASITIPVPALPGITTDGLLLYAQGARVDTVTQQVLISNTVSFRIDL